MFGFFSKKKKKVQIKTLEKPSPAVNKSMTSGEVLRALSQIQKELDRLKLAVTGGVSVGSADDANKIVEQTLNEIQERAGAIRKSENEKIIEGVFDGQAMVGADGQHYDVPANYASKSKLVEGDILKLTINNLGAFVYKQIKPIERLRKVGKLDQDPQSLQFYASAEGKKWKLLTASVTYFKGEPGDEVVFLIPAEGGSRSAAVENIVKL